METRSDRGRWEGWAGVNPQQSLRATTSTSRWIFSLSLLAMACSAGAGEGSPEEAPPAIPPTVRDSAGITIVENAEPQWAPGQEWRVGGLLTVIGTVQGDPAHELFNAREGTRLSNGDVAVGNSSNGEIRFFRQDGSHIRTVGSTGGGPGEFSGANAIQALQRVPGDTLIAWDIYAQKISVFAPDGEFVRSFALAGPAQQHFFGGIFADRSLQMYVHEYAREESAANLPEGLIRRNISLHRYGLDHTLSNSLRDQPGSDQFQARWGDYGMMMTEAPFGRNTSVNVGGTRTYVATGDSNQISVYDQTGQPEIVIRRTMAPIEVTGEMIRLDRARRMEEERGELEEWSVEPRVLRMIEALPYPSTLPPYSRTVLDSGLNLWVEEFRVTEDEPYEWSVFDHEGVWLGRISLPVGLEVFEIGSDYILGRVYDELDVERIEVHRLIKP